MTRQRNIFLIALAGSLGLHLAALEIYVGYAFFRGSPSRKLATADPELIVRLDDLGDDKGTGIGSNSSPGDHPIQAPQADEDQALLSRDQAGVGRIGAPPSKWTGPTGDGAGGTPAVAVPAPPSPPTAPPKPPAPPQPTPATPPVKVAAAIPAPQAKVAPIASETKPKVVETPTPPPAVTAAAQPTPPVPVAKPQAATGDGRRPGLPAPSADPLPQSDSDSDPFSRISGTVVFHDGRLDVRMGRKVKTTRPQVGFGGQIDLITLNNPVVVLEVHINPTGKVTDVKIAHSSGSNQIDEPTRLAVYDWWFEPAKDKNGKPVSDVVFFTVEFR